MASVSHIWRRACRANECCSKKTFEFKLFRFRQDSWKSNALCRVFHVFVVSNCYITQDHQRNGLILRLIYSLIFLEGLRTNSAGGNVGCQYRSWSWDIRVNLYNTKEHDRSWKTAISALWMLGFLVHTLPVPIQFFSIQLLDRTWMVVNRLVPEIISRP